MTATQIIRKMAGVEPTSAPLPVCEVCNDTGVVLIDCYPAAPAGFEDRRFCTCHNGSLRWAVIERNARQCRVCGGSGAIPILGYRAAQEICGACGGLGRGRAFT
jgi:hypothetical protein